MTHRPSRPRTAAVAVVGTLAAVVLGAAGCSTEKAAAGGSEEALQNAFTSSEAALRKLEKLSVDGPVASADFLTPEYLEQHNAMSRSIEAGGNRMVGQRRFESIKRVQYSIWPRPVTSMRVCSVGDVRMLDEKGKDVTVGLDRKPKPKGQSREAIVYDLESRDEGKTFLVKGALPDGRC